MNRHKWTIIIQGEGPIENPEPYDDADYLGESFVAQLQIKGHTIETATFSEYPQKLRSNGKMYHNLLVGHTE